MLILNCPKVDVTIGYRCYHRLWDKPTFDDWQNSRKSHLMNMLSTILVFSDVLFLPFVGFGLTLMFCQCWSCHTLGLLQHGLYGMPQNTYVQRNINDSRVDLGAFPFFVQTNLPCLLLGVLLPNILKFMIESKGIRRNQPV